MTIKFTEINYKYRLLEDAFFQLDFAPPHDIVTPYIEFYSTGKLILKTGYACDGCSGPTKDDETNIQGGFVHDSGYQMMREGMLDGETYRPLFDSALEKICLIDGMSRFRAFYYFEGVHLFGERYARNQVEQILTCGKEIDLTGGLAQCNMQFVYR